MEDLAKTGADLGRAGYCPYQFYGSFYPRVYQSV
jgi:hypothetical protein